MSMDELSEKWRERVQEELDPEEQVLWMGSPDPARTAGRPLSTPAARVGVVTFATAVGWLMLAMQIVGPPRPGQPYPWIILLPALFSVIAFAFLVTCMPFVIMGRHLPHWLSLTLYLFTDK